MRTGWALGSVVVIFIASAAYAQARRSRAAPSPAARFWCTGGRAASSCDTDRTVCEEVRQRLFDEAIESGRCAPQSSAFCFRYDDEEYGPDRSQCMATAAHCAAALRSIRVSNRATQRYSNFTACGRIAAARVAAHDDAGAGAGPAEAAASALPPGFFYCDEREPFVPCYRAGSDCLAAARPRSDTAAGALAACAAASVAYCYQWHGEARCFRASGACATSLRGLPIPSSVAPGDRPACRVEAARPGADAGAWWER